MKLLVLSGAIAVMVLPPGVRLAAEPDKAVPTFNRDVAPIIFKNCVTCHRPNQAAPMTLRSYKEVRPWARAIKDKVLKREMPPWHVDARFGEFRNDRRLSDEQIKTIAAWADGGAPEGAAPLTADLPSVNDGWSHPSGRPPDLIIEMAFPFKAPAEGELPNFNLYQELPPELKQKEHFLEALQILPGVVPAMHHASVGIVPLPPGTKIGRGEAWPGGPIVDGALLNAKTGRLAGGTGDVNEGNEAEERAAGRGQPQEDLPGTRFCCYVPGGSFMHFRPGAGKRLPTNGVVVWGVHYTLIGKPFEDRTRVGFWFQEELTHEIVEKGGGGDRNSIVLGQEIVLSEANPLQGRGRGAIPALPVIPPHTKDWAITAIQVFQDDAVLYTLWPHMHTRGKEMTYVLTFPDGREQVLLSNPRYDFNWQIYYDLKEPLKIPAGSTIKTIGSYDNSAANKWNAAPHKEVYWSEQSWDEMYNGFMEVSFDKRSRQLQQKTSARPTTSAAR